VKTLYYDGVAAVTQDDVAAAVLQLALVAAQYRRYEAVTLPVLVHGQTEELTLILGPTIHLSALTQPYSGEPEIEGAVDAVLRITERAKALAAPLRPLGDGPGEGTRIVPSM
jgi:hypothetical protein